MTDIAFIGTRQPDQLPGAWVALYTSAAAAAGIHGYRLVTGAAEGCDQLAAQCALARGGPVLLVLPWPEFNQEWCQRMVHAYGPLVRFQIYSEREHPGWLESVHRYHPNAPTLKRGALALHARNFGIVANAQHVVALPSEKIGGGGTGQGIRIARARGLSLFDLSQPADRDRLQKGLTCR